MFNHMKYVMIENWSTKVPILFSPSLNHADVARYQGTCLSAGFCDINLESGEVSVFGASTSLDIKSNKEDAEIIKYEINKWKQD